MTGGLFTRLFVKSNSKGVVSKIVNSTLPVQILEFLQVLCPLHYSYLIQDYKGRPMTRLRKQKEEMLRSPLATSSPERGGWPETFHGRLNSEKCAVPIVQKAR